LFSFVSARRIIIPLAAAVLLIPFRDKSISILDASIQQPYIVRDTMPILKVVMISLSVPLVLFALYPYLFARFHKKVGLPQHEFSWWYFYWWTSCILQTIGLTVLLSELSKRLLQVPRPDFLARCFTHGMPEDIHQAAIKNNYILNTASCIYDDRAVYEDGLQSMPSEHTSLTWCMMTILFLYFATLRRELLVAAIAGHARNSLAPVMQPGATAAAVGQKKMKTISAAAITAKPDPDSLISGAAPALHGGVVAFPSPAESSTDLDVRLARETARLAEQDEFEEGAQKRVDRTTGEVVYVKNGRAGSFWPISHVVALAHLLLPVGWAIAVSLSRAFDHRHAAVDILVGAVLGVAVAWCVFAVHRTQFEKYHARWTNFNLQSDEDDDL
jgi:membrane-associated phospholipid phosphatase